MFLDYFALGATLVGLTLAFYTFIYIHDIPYQVAKKRNHPQSEAIHIACWLSVFTLHALWPIVFIWAVMKPQSLSVKVGDSDEVAAELRGRIAFLETELLQIKADLTAQSEGAQS